MIVKIIKMKIPKPIKKDLFDTIDKEAEFITVCSKCFIDRNEQVHIIKYVEPAENNTYMTHIDNCINIQETNKKVICINCETELGNINDFDLIVFDDSEIEVIWININDHLIKEYIPKH